MRPFRDLSHETDEQGSGLLQQALVPRPGGKGEHLPAQPVVQGVRIPVDETELVQGAQRPGYLTLFAAHQTGDLHDPQPVTLYRPVGGKDE